MVRIRGSELLPPEERGSEVTTDRYKTIRMECTKGGKFVSKSKNPSKGSTSTMTGCKFRVNAVRDGPGSWRVTVVALEHNHECSPGHSKYLTNYKYITEGNKKWILDMDRAGVPIAKNFTSFVVEKGNHDNVDFTERDL